MTRVAIGWGSGLLLVGLALYAVCTGPGAGTDLIDEVQEGRSRLPPSIVRLLERPSRIELIALDDPGAFEPHLRAFPRSSIRARFVLGARAEQRTLVRALYRAVGRGSFYGLCFHPHHALHVARGRDALTIAICLQCSQLAYETRSVDGELHYVPIDSRMLHPTLDRLFAPRGLRFDPTRPYFGGWS